MQSLGRALTNSISCWLILSAIIFATSSMAASLSQGSGLSTKTAFSQKELHEFAQHAHFRFSVISNFTRDGNSFEAQISINNQSSVALPAGAADWRIYFHFVRKIAPSEVAGLRISHIQGDLHQIEPTVAFAGLSRSKDLTINFTARAHIASYGEFMPRAFIVLPGLIPEIFANTDSETPSAYVDAFTRPEQWLRFNKPTPDLYPLATAATRYRDNLAVNNAVPTQDRKQQVAIIPTPHKVTYQRGNVLLDNSWTIDYPGGLTTEAHYLQKRLKQVGLPVAAQMQPVAKKSIQLRLDPTAQKAESYQLVIDNQNIVITGKDNAGVFYGIQSLLSLLPPQIANHYEIPKAVIADAPRFPWRGMHYDMARNFHGKAVTLRLIEQMGRYKLNRLHLHLTEDEGWRLEIPGLPELTDVGAFRCFDLAETQCLLTQLGTGPHRNGSGNGFYSTADFIEILRYAADRHIEVIPEIDMPGHARAAIKSMEARHRKLIALGKEAEAKQYLLSDPDDQSQYTSVQNYSDNAVNVCLPSTYAFIEKVIYELQQMYRQAGLQLKTYHMGGDEVGKGSWTASPACQKLIANADTRVAGTADLKPYFVSKLSDITYRRGLALKGWEDGLMYDPKNAFNRQHFSNQRVLANAWDNIWELGVADRAYRLANLGYEVILSPSTHLYFDHPYETHPEERGYYWATRYSDTRKVFGFMPDNLYANADKTLTGEKITNLENLLRRPLPALEKPENIKGMQGQLWGETVRTAAQFEQMIYPRLMALAERAWFKAGWEAEQPDELARAKDWGNFSRTLTAKELPKLANTGADFYLPPPGGIVESNTLMANTSLAGLTIEFSLDAGKSWQQYQGAHALKNHGGKDQSIVLRSRLGDKVSRATTVEAVIH